MSVGDVNSNARGSGARYNDDKPNLALIPLAMIATTVPYGLVNTEEEHYEQQAVRNALGFLSMFQITGRVDALDAALRTLAPWWEECARVFDYGRRKYAEWNWAKGMAWSIPLACGARHALATIRGEALDEESRGGSGLRHVGHFMCNLVMLRAYVETFPEGNDLPDPKLFQAPEAPANPDLEVTYDTAPAAGETVVCTCDRCQCTEADNPGPFN